MSELHVGFVKTLVEFKYQSSSPLIKRVFEKTKNSSISAWPSSQYLHFEDNMFGQLYNLLKCGRPGGRGGDNLPPKGHQIRSASGGVEPINYDDDDADDDDDDDDNDFGDDDDDDDMFSSSQWTPNTIGTRGGQ